MAKHSQHHTTGWQVPNTSDASYYYKQVPSLPESRFLGIPTLGHPPAQHFSTPYPPVHQREKLFDDTWLTVVEPVYTELNTQSWGNQNYMSPTLVVPESQASACQIGANQLVGMPKNINCPRTDVSSYPTMSAPGYSPHNSTVTPASSSVSDFSSSPQWYQVPSPRGHSYPYNYFSSSAAPGYASYPPPVTGQFFQVDERFQGTPQPNPASNNRVAYYDPGYYRTNWFWSVSSWTE